MLAPILVFAYNRPDHLKQTIASLLKNPLAKSSVLYAFSDGAKTDFEIEKINEVRDYLRKVSGFADIILEFSEENKGLAKSVIEGVSKVINLHDKVIVLEDDLLVSADFLTFMNNALDFYQNEEKVGSVSGYSFLLENCEDAREINAVHRISSWGWGTWKDRWELVDWELKDFEAFKNNKFQVDAFKNGGNDLWPMIQKQNKGLINSWAIRWTYSHFTNQMVCMVPKYSKVKNIGTDGSGTNFKSNTEEYLTKAVEAEISFSKDIKADPKVSAYIRNTFKTSIFRRLFNFLKFGIRS